MNQNVNVERLVAQFQDARRKLGVEVEAAIRTLEEAKARLEAGETPLQMPPESLWANYREAGTLGEAVEMVNGR